ncbi:MAG: hypothetical protein ACUVUD_03770 [bacterium]
MRKTTPPAQYKLGANLVQLFILLTLIFAQCGKPTVIWKRVIDTGTEEHAAALLLQNNELILAGTQGKLESGRTVMFVQFLDRKGNLLRRRSFAEGSQNICRAAGLDSAGNLLLAGYSRLYDTTFALIIKVKPTGKTLWKKGIMTGTASWANSISTLDSNIIFCGGLESESGIEAFLALLDPDGKTVWSRNYRIDHQTDAVALAAHSSGNLTILCRVSSSSSNNDILLMQTKPNGDTLWTRRYDSGGDDIPAALALDRFGNIVAIGTARTNDSTRCVILEYTPDGGVVRKVAYGEQTQAEAANLTITEKGDIFICGTVITPQRRKILVFQYLPTAPMVWERQIDLGLDARGVALAFDRGIFLAANVVQKTPDVAILCLDWSAQRD